MPDPATTASGCMLYYWPLGMLNYTGHTGLYLPWGMLDYTGLYWPLGMLDTRAHLFVLLAATTDKFPY